MRWSLTDDYDERYFKDYDLANLRMDEFYLNINASSLKEYYLYTLKRECYECPYLRYDGRNNTKNIFRSDLKFRIALDSLEYSSQNRDENVVCDIDENFGQYGVYNIHVDSDFCQIETLKEPKNIYLPILTVTLIYTALFLVIYILCYGWKKLKKRNNKNPKEPEKSLKKERVSSLDTFRGISIVVMIFANYGTGGYDILNHSKWNGIQLADLVFPWFMWIMGACIPISLSSSFKKNISNSGLIGNILERSIKLFVIGLILGSGTDLKFLRLFGVLQRFAVSYFCCSIICVYCMKRSTDSSLKKVQVYFEDILKIYSGWIVVILILIAHTTIIFFVAAPGCPKGYFGPGGLHRNRSFVNCTGGATGYIDGLLLGNHRYQRPTIYKIYEAKPFDPEGIVGCLTSIIHVFIGVQAGITLMVYKKHQERLYRWLLWAVVLGVLAGLLCGFSKENGLIPINKNLWSLSFVFLTSSLAFILLSFSYVLIDFNKWWSGKPFLFVGMNALLIYIGHEVTAGMFPVRWYPHNKFRPEDPRTSHFISLLSDLWGVAVWILISYYWHKIGFFFNV